MSRAMSDNPTPNICGCMCHKRGAKKSEAMTSQRDEAQKALEIAKAENERLRENWKIKAQQFLDDIDVIVEKKWKAEARAESAEATIRGQAERIKELEESLALTQSLSSQIWDAAEVAWKE